MDYTRNNLSMATQQYLGKCCLAPQHPAISEGCKAPPPTPEPASKNEITSNIFDITRLKKLPKVLKTSHNGVRELAQKFLNTVVNFEPSQKKRKS
ncbi:hypothetical protein pdam_00020630 [Pocillopora damicornis]|uniref:Uncharacterized protein n=1 Tax=Pocillopora damicornis TaxID=46731 RepID=A0A3M6UI11_POCDA|nr:hypothetical protein pdam_00020630 [Pocillopora damicornis]